MFDSGNDVEKTTFNNLTLDLLAHQCGLLTSFNSGSHLVARLVNSYPQYNIINLDRLDYCAEPLNLIDVHGAPNYQFVKVSYPDIFLILFAFISVC